ncbi:hypothetical protein GGS23DRAFT_605096 [Durotheca rogersii]|uniref:uncharacterized protein n=1 Tax=Durotheca rogersii TaxID=419775 RepID=UPI0022202C07|nr:uncharacterized protein GGS23DRAFT_605096 [Durotheca rogersii]KAI5863570.1 hypothetical protein GGS23DRAFT_605096 [Durotheca rogersii]
MLAEATAQGVRYVARCHRSETVQVSGSDDDIQHSVRWGLDVITATNHRLNRRIRKRSNISNARRERSSAARATSLKRLSSPASSSDLLPPAKRPYSAPPTRAAHALTNHGTSTCSLLGAFKYCIEGYESLYEAGFLDRDISIQSLIINEDENNPESRNNIASGAKGKILGTRAFMAIDALLGERHSFTHDLDTAGAVPEFDNDERDFLRDAEAYSTPYHQPLIPCVSKLRGVVFRNGRWAREDQGLYTRMRKDAGGGRRRFEGMVSR